MTPHGPDTTTYEAAIKEGAEQPAHLGRTTLAFMFETSLTPRVTPAALGSPCIDRDYYKCWVGLKSHFDRDWHAKQDMGSSSSSQQGLLGSNSSSMGGGAVREQQEQQRQGVSNGVGSLAEQVGDLALQVPEGAAARQ
jgi:homogentisate 1,2-dioxygenase